jgi:hypothetical protein
VLLLLNILLLLVGALVVGKIVAVAVEQVDC